jgi:WD40 repeat protein
VVVGDEDGTVRVLDFATRRESERFDWDIGPIRSLTASPDGMTFAAGGTEGRVVVWDAD